MAELNEPKFEKLSRYLDMDPNNLSLLGETATAAFDEGHFDDARRLLDRQQALSPLPPEQQHLAGLVAMRQHDWIRAATQFETLLTGGIDAPAIRFNLAWSRAMAKQFADALEVLDEQTSHTLPQAAELEVQLLHQLGEFERAEARARALLGLHKAHRGLNAAISTLAVDIEDAELALSTARMAGDHPEALATLGTLALADDEIEAASALFDAALVRNPEAPRAWIGRGLTRMLRDDKQQAAIDLDKGADLFGTHQGSWIAAGWAHLVAGNRETARLRFERALALDSSFAEAQGSIAVIELLDGDVEAARRRSVTARRLDRGAFSVALVSMLLAAGDGEPDTAKRIFDAALNSPVAPDGKTLAQALVRLQGG